MAWQPSFQSSTSVFVTGTGTEQKTTFNVGDSEEIDPEQEAQENGTVLFLARSDQYPYVKDYAGTYNDQSFSDTTLPAEDSSHILSAYTLKTSDFGYAAALETYGDLAIRVVFTLPQIPEGDINLVDYGGSGEDEATNYLWNINAKEGQVNLFSEVNAGEDQDPSWDVPGKLQAGRDYLLEFRRTVTGEVRCYLNGLQLQRVDTVGVEVDDGDGVVSNMTPSGTQATLINSPLTQDYLLHYLHVLDDFSTISSPADYASAKGLVWTDDELLYIARDDHQTIAQDSDVVLCLEPENNDLVDRAGTVQSWTTTGGTIPLIGGQYWTEKSTNWVATTGVEPLRLTSSLTVQALFQRSDETTDRIVGFYGDGEAAADNYLWRISVSDEQLSMFTETGEGDNVSTQWTITLLEVDDIAEYCLVREDLGDGTGRLKLWERVFPSSTWVMCEIEGQAGVTEEIVDLPTGGEDAWLEVNEGSTAQRMRQVIVRNAPVEPI